MPTPTPSANLISLLAGVVWYVACSWYGGRVEVSSRTSATFSWLATLGAATAIAAAWTL